MKRIIALLSVATNVLLFSSLYAQPIRQNLLLDKDWKFIQTDVPSAAAIHFDDSNWQNITIPHDWAINGPFDRKYDLQTVTITQNNETSASIKTGRTGGLPYIGVGWYLRTFDVPEFDTSKTAQLIFDGAMSQAEVFVNGKKVCSWPYGYNTFFCDITPYLNVDGKNNQLAVRLENLPESSRWYPGAGLYRNVHLLVTNRIHIPIWGTYITTPVVNHDFASIKLKAAVDNADGQFVTIKTRILDEKGNVITTKENSQILHPEQPLEQNFTVNKPQLWSPEKPTLYTAETSIFINNKQYDQYSTRFGIRSFVIAPDKGAYLNGKPIKFKGVCNHHDLGPLGAAVNRAALKHQLTILKDMGSNAIRTSHNMPAPELVELCDEMGFMVIVEPFDEWEEAKCLNGYHRFFYEWAEKDMVNMVRHYRNNPSVVMWSIGNEVPTQCNNMGYKVAGFLQDICHREDPSRLVTCGMDQATCVLGNGFAAQIDIPGFNYRVNRYLEAREKLPQGVLLGSETSSTVSSRGVYKFPVEVLPDAIYPDHQSSSYDYEYSNWANIPEYDFMMSDDYDWTLGQFVWTGFDYLGEPAPYDTDAWPNHSSLYGIVDLASLPKDRFYLYRSLWNTSSPTLHILPHWNWAGREGEVTPIFVYTSYPTAEIFINGKSQGKRTKDKSNMLDRYRLRWMDARYEPGEVRVVAYDSTGIAKEEKVIRTAGKPHHVVLSANKATIAADGKDLVYITVQVADANGNICPTESSEVTVGVSGNGKFVAAANGDPTCLTPFQSPKQKLFSGALTAIVQANETPGIIAVTVKSKGLKKGIATLRTE